MTPLVLTGADVVVVAVDVAVVEVVGSTVVVDVVVVLVVVACLTGALDSFALALMKFCVAMKHRKMPIRTAIAMARGRPDRGPGFLGGDTSVDTCFPTIAEGRRMGKLSDDRLSRKTTTILIVGFCSTTENVQLGQASGGMPSRPNRLATRGSAGGRRLVEMVVLIRGVLRGSTLQRASS